MSVELASTYVSLIPSAAGIQGNIAKELGAPVQKAAADAGGKASKSFGSKFSSGFKSLATAGAIAGIAKFGVDSVKAFSESEQAQTRLADAFSKFPALAGGNIDALRSYNSELAKKTKFDDDATASGQAVLAQFGLTAGQIKQATPLLQDYAARTGKDLPSAAKVLGKAVLGQGRALKDVGLNLKDAGSKTANFDQLMGGLRKQVGGFAAKEGKTTAGQAEILKNQFGELQETVGSKLVPVLSKLATAGLATVNFLSNLPGPVKAAIVVVAGLAAGVVLISKATQAWKAAQEAWLVVQKVATGAQVAFNAVMAANPIVLVVAAIVALGLAFFVAYKKVKPFHEAVDAVGRFLRDKIPPIFAAVGRAIAAVFDWVKKNWPLILAILTGPIGLAVLVIAKNWSKIKNGAIAVKDFIVDKFDKLVGFFTKLPGRLARIGSGMFDFIKEGFKAALNFVIRGWNRLEFRIPGFHKKILGKSIGFDGFTIGVPDIPELAKGGRLTKGGMALVGENGPELVNLPKFAQVLPNKVSERIASTAQRAVGGPTLIVQQHPGEDVISAGMRGLKWHDRITATQAAS